MRRHTKWVFCWPSHEKELTSVFAPLYIYRGVVYRRRGRAFVHCNGLRLEATSGRDTASVCGHSMKCENFFSFPVRKFSSIQSRLSSSCTFQLKRHDVIFDIEFRKPAAVHWSVQQQKNINKLWVVWVARVLVGVGVDKKMRGSCL